VTSPRIGAKPEAGSAATRALYGEYMTDRRGDQGFTVTPQRLGGGRGGPGGSRRRRLGLAVVSAAAAAILTIGWLGPRLTGRPNLDISFFATPTPSSTPFAPTATPAVVPIEPAIGTPLPSITRPEGVVASGRVAVVTDGFRILDLASGDIAEGPSIQYGRDAIVRASSGGGWTCVCFRDGESDGRQTVTVEIIGIGASGERSDTTTLADLPNPIQAETGQPTITSDLDTFDGNRRGLLAYGIRDGTNWRFTVSPLHIDRRQLGASVAIGKATAPVPVPSADATAEPSPQGRIDLYLDGPHVRVSPDGRVAFVWANLQRVDEQGNAITAMHAWRVTLSPDGSVDAVEKAPALLDVPPFCPWLGFAAADRLAWLCPDFSDTGTGGSWRFGSIDLDGRPVGSTRVPLNQDQFFGAPLLDRANGQVYSWDPTGLTITRIDVRTATVVRTTFDPLAASSPGLAPGGGSAPPEWHDADSTVKLNGFGAMAGSPSGDRLYVVGFDPPSGQDSGAQPSRGIFVIDRSTLALVDRWAPAANYVAVSTLPDGLVAASGMAGIQTNGQFAPWQGSLTIHEPADGQVLVRFGQLGEGNAPFVVDR
jgi:hypothetical protein